MTRRAAANMGHCVLLLTQAKHAQLDAHWVFSWKMLLACCSDTAGSGATTATAAGCWLPRQLTLNQVSSQGMAKAHVCGGRNAASNPSTICCLHDMSDTAFSERMQAGNGRQVTRPAEAQHSHTVKDSNEQYACQYYSFIGCCSPSTCVHAACACMHAHLHGAHCRRRHRAQHAITPLRPVHGQQAREGHLGSNLLNRLLLCSLCIVQKLLLRLLLLGSTCRASSRLPAKHARHAVQEGATAPVGCRCCRGACCKGCRGTGRRCCQEATWHGCCCAHLSSAGRDAARVLLVDGDLLQGTLAPVCMMGGGGEEGGG